MRKEKQSRLEYIGFKVLLKLLSLLPYSLIRFLLANLFVFGGYYLHIRRKVAFRNLQYIFPDKQKEEMDKIIKGMYYNFGLTAAEIYFEDFQQTKASIEVEGWQNLKNALKRKRGLILATGHIGNWELAGRYIASKLKMAVVAKRQRNRYFDNHLNKMREEAGMKIIFRKKALKPIFKYLKRNYIITLLIDQNAGDDGIRTDFLGKSASTYVGAAKIALKKGVPVVVGIAYRKQDGTNVFRFEKPILSDDKSTNDMALKNLTEHISKKLEYYILKYPEQWFWVHKRWKGAKKAKTIEE